VDNTIKSQSPDSGKISTIEEKPSYTVEESEVGDSSLQTEELSYFEERIKRSETLIDENYINKTRLKSLKLKFTKKLITLISEEDFEYGIGTKADKLVKEQMQLNLLVSKTWLNSIFVENFENIHVLIGLLRIITRIDYQTISPEGQTMAIAALSHKNTEVKECGVRAYESWGTQESLKILENLEVSPSWLQEYINEVVSDIRNEHNVSINEKD